jgi:hypothetical protein
MKKRALEENSLSKGRNKKFICFETSLLTLLPEKLWRLKYRLCSQNKCPRRALSRSPRKRSIRRLPPMHGQGLLGPHILEHPYGVSRGGVQI